MMVETGGLQAINMRYNLRSRRVISDVASQFNHQYLFSSFSYTNLSVDQRNFQRGGADG